MLTIFSCPPNMPWTLIVALIYTVICDQYPYLVSARPYTDIRLSVQLDTRYRKRPAQGCSDTLFILGEKLRTNAVALILVQRCTTTCSTRTTERFARTRRAYSGCLVPLCDAAVADAVAPDVMQKNRFFPTHLKVLKIETRFGTCVRDGRSTG